jgi:hypothetical protein
VGFLYPCIPRIVNVAETFDITIDNNPVKITNFQINAYFTFIFNFHPNTPSFDVVFYVSIKKSIAFFCSETEAMAGVENTISTTIHVPTASDLCIFSTSYTW